jgi:hypothetical protein
VYLTEGAEHRAQYVRQLCVVLMTWTKWHDFIPGCLYTEEANEASLSPLGTLCRSHRRMRTISDVMDLFLLVPLPPPGPHSRPSHSPTPELVQTIDQHMSQFVRHGRRVVTYAPWEGESGSEAKEDWPNDWWTPRPLSETFSERHLHELNTYAMLTLLRVPRPLSENMVQSLDRNIPRRSPDASAAAAGVVDKVLTHQMPSRYTTGAMSTVRTPASAGVPHKEPKPKAQSRPKPTKKATAKAHGP